MSIASALSRTFRCDLFLSDASLPGEGISYVAMEPDNELLISDSTSREEMAKFAFADNRPTLGYLSYGLGMKCMAVKSSHKSPFPFGHMKKYAAIVSFDMCNGGLSVNTHDDKLRNRTMHYIASSASSLGKPIPDPIETDDIAQSLSRDEYIDRARQTIEYIRAGDVYQLCLSLKYSVTLGRPIDARTAITLFIGRPAAYYAFFNSGRYQILSTSPECFLRVRDGRVMSRPIKGTLQFDDYDDNFVLRLKSSPKEDAELSMIVDLIRNDISRNCEYGSVAVTDHKSVFAVDNLLQMYSTVEGKLRSDRTCLDLLIDAFPGGSVTGCPKRRAMELIDELEPHSRDIYCGSFFIISDPKTMHSSINIRTGYFDHESSVFSFFAGSGIVVESDPASEYDETIAKAGKFLDLLRR